MSCNDDGTQVVTEKLLNEFLLTFVVCISSVKREFIYCWIIVYIRGDCHRVICSLIFFIMLILNGIFLNLKIRAFIWSFLSIIL